jgi:hypothetical protein
MKKESKTTNQEANFTSSFCGLVSQYSEYIEIKVVSGKRSARQIQYR